MEDIKFKVNNESIEKEYDIYLANSLFSEADRIFNLSLANKIRASGFVVFLPQEQNFNLLEEPTEYDVFINDTEALQKSKILIACIDQETIDCGVACEIGIAYKCNIPIIGLYTDIRRERKKSKMYKNLYVLGAIKSNGLIVHSIDEVVNYIRNYFQNTSTSRKA